jgi:hypothetical protein
MRKFEVTLTVKISGSEEMFCNEYGDPDFSTSKARMILDMNEIKNEALAKGYDCETSLKAIELP